MRIGRVVFVRSKDGGMPNLPAGQQNFALSDKTATIGGRVLKCLHSSNPDAAKNLTGRRLPATCWNRDVNDPHALRRPVRAFEA
jgi:hypothetical protein